ncbi:MAG: acetolactate synthase, large subunit, biosynthetic type [Candidatus Margulisbacteria bacterium GWF2_35_9]|nr:MAG: acetolactate synthase, large subunit, biosynthetic type [Candidatus Margulisbacteria bacterium GWF2_35_9]
MTEKIKGSKIFIESLKQEQVTDIFGYPGGALLEIYDDLYDSDINHYLVRHEQAAAHAADGYARSSGKVGVCLATSGPGATNLVTGIANAYMDSIPMVAFTGQVNLGAIGKDSFQEADITGITLPITKHNFLVKDVKDLASTIKKAFHIARTGRPGPVLIDMPKDITLNRAVFNYPDKVDLPSYKPTIKGSIKQIKAAVELMQESERPVVLAGGGVTASNASDELRTFIKQTNIPVASTLLGLGVYPYDDELSLRMPGMHGTAYANYAIHDADLLIAIGMRFDDRITGKLATFAPKAKVIHIDIDPAEISKCIAATVPIVGDAKEVLKDLIEYIKENPVEKKDEWLRTIQEYKTNHPLIYKMSADTINPQYVIQQINEMTKGNVIMATEVGTHQMWAAQYQNHIYPRHFISSGGLGTMGFGFPAAIGAQVANPDKLVVNIAGDGSIQMNIQELSTVANYNLPVKVIILNNRYLGMVRQWQEIFYKKRYSHTDLEGKQPDFVKVAEAYDVMGLRAEKPSQVRSVLEKAFAHNGPVFVDMVVNREENVFPMVPAGGVLNKMILQKEGK